MTSRDMEFLARKIVSLERKHDTLARAKQLPSSSVQLVDGTDVGISDGVETAQDTQDGLGSLYEHSDEIGDNADEEAINTTIIPTWIREVDYNIDASWDAAQQVSDRVVEAQAEADQASADALAASIAAANAAAQAQTALDTLQNTVVSSVIEYAVGESETVAPTAGWSTDNPEPVEDEFVWMRTVVTYVDETTFTSTPVLMSRGGGGEPVKIDSLTTFYTVTASAPPIVMPELPTTVDPSPWWSQPPPYSSGVLLVSTERIIYSDETFAYTEPKFIHEWVAAGEAQAEAGAAKYLAEGIYTTIPSATEPTTRANGSPLVQGDQWWKISTDPETAGNFIGVGVWNGTTWQDRQLIADSLLVPGSVGAILIGDGQITAPKLAVDALDFQTAQGMSIYGTYIEGGELRLADAQNIQPLWSHDCETLTGWSGTTLSLSTDTNIGTHSIKGTGLVLDLPRPPATEPVAIQIWVKVTGPDDFNTMRLGIRGPTYYVLKDIELPNDQWVLLSEDITYPDALYDIRLGGVLDPGAYIQVSQVSFLERHTVNTGVRIYRDAEGWAKLESEGSNDRMLTISDGRIHGENRLTQSEMEDWVDAPSGTRVWPYPFGKEYVKVGSSWIQNARMTDHGTLTIGDSMYYPGDEPSLKLERWGGSGALESRFSLGTSEQVQGVWNLERAGSPEARMYFEGTGRLRIRTYSDNVLRIIPFASAANQVTKRNVNAGAVNNTTVTFPAGRFTVSPRVTATLYGDARDTNVLVDSVTETGFTLRLASNSTVTRNIGAHWIALQMTPTNGSG